MPKTYYDSELTAEQIEAALKAIADVVNPSNNGKVMYIDDGKIKAASASRWGHGAVLEPLSVTANGDYTPPTGIDGFDSVHVAVPSATLTTKSITQNGTYIASSDNADGYSSVTVNVSGGGSAVVQPLSVTQNGTYNPPSGVDGYAPVTVNVSGGSGSDWPFIDSITDGGTPYFVQVNGPNVTFELSDYSESVQLFYNSYARSKPTAAQFKATVIPSDSGLSLQEFVESHPPAVTMEYYGNVYGNSNMIQALGLQLLGDFSQTGSSQGNKLSESILNFSGVILQGIYNGQRGSQYNTSMLYVTPSFFVQYWTGMKDRNNNYDCRVTFEDETTVSLTGNRQVIIYGIP